MHLLAKGWCSAFLAITSVRHPYIGYALTVS